MHMPLMAAAAYQPIIDHLAEQRIIYEWGPGGVGDYLIHYGAGCLFEQIGTRIVTDWSQADWYVWGGGGNLGSLWPEPQARRQRGLKQAQEWHLPCLIMPQSLTVATEREAFPPGTIVLAREAESQALLPGSLLVPDTALAIDHLPDYLDDWSTETGYFFRTDRERNPRASTEGFASVDPQDVCHNDMHALLRLIAPYGNIVTDRLHTAIAGLLLDRYVTLLPNSYHKNRSMYDTWLRNLGCRWRNFP